MQTFMTNFITRLWINCQKKIEACQKQTIKYDILLYDYFQWVLKKKLSGI